MAFTCRAIVAARRRTDGAHVDIDFAATKSRDDAVIAAGDGDQRLSIRHHGKGNFRSFDDRARRGAPLHSGIEEPLRLRSSPVITGDLMTCGEEPLDHSTAHDAETDKT